MQGGAVLIPAPFPVCDGGPVLFSVFLSRFPCATGPRPVSRVRWGPVLFPVFLSRFPHAAGSCPVSRSVPFPVCDGGLFCFRVSVSFPACSGFLPCSPVCNTGFLARSWCCRAFPRCLPNQVRSFSLVTFFSLRKESNKEVGRPMTFSRLPSMDSMMSSGCSWMA